MSKNRYISLPGHVVNTYGICSGVLENMTILFLVLVRYSTEHQPQLFTFWSTVNKDSLTMFVNICFLDDDLSFWSEIESHGSFCINCPGVLDVE